MEKKLARRCHILLRKDLSVDYYVSRQQIRSLFSRWSKQLRQGTLIAPTSSNDEMNVDCNGNECKELDEDGDAEQYQTELHHLAKVSVVWFKGEWLVILYENEWYPGVIVEVTGTGTVVDCMKNVSIGKNCFRWHTPKDIMTYSDDEIVCKISPPIPISRHGDYSLLTIDFDEANKLTRK